MPTLRAIRLLQSVEAGNTLGAELETFLQDDGRLGEIKFLLSMRGQTRRIATNPVTIAAFLLSPKAIDAVFTLATPSNNTASTAMVASPVAMAALSVDSSALDSIFGNVTSRNLFTASENYSENVLSVTTLLGGLSRTTYSTKTLLFASPPAMTAVFSDLAAARSVVVDQDMLTRAAASSIAVETIATSPEILGVFAPSSMAMTTFAANNSAMQEFIVNDDPMEIFSQSPVAMAAISSNAAAWTTFQSSVFFDTHLKNIICNIAGLNSSSFATVAAIIANATALAAVASNTQAVQALLGNSAALTALVSSPNLSGFLGSSVAMTEVTSDEALMNSLITDATAFPILLANAAAKTAIFTTPALVTTMMTAGSDSLATLQAAAVSKTLVNNVVIGSYQSMGVSGNIIILTAVMGSIVATTLPNYFKGDTQAIAEFALPGTSLASGPVAINLPFTNAQWDIASIAATAAGNVTFTYVDFN
jgi:hypothetical protein